MSPVNTNATCAKLRTQEVADACRRCIKSIDKARALAKERSIARCIPRRFFMDRTPEEAEKYAEAEHMWGAPWHYMHEYQRDHAKRILALAERTEYPEMFVSSEDYEAIGSHWPEVGR